MLGIVDGFLVELPGTSDCVITAQDGSGDAVSPVALVATNPSADSANIIHNQIDGSIAVTLIGDRPASGNLQLVFSSDAQATAARALLARPTSFTLACASRSVLNMTFVRAGALGMPLHSELDDVWEFSVGYQAVIV